MTPVRNPEMPEMPVMTITDQVNNLRLQIAERDKTIAELHRELGSMEVVKARLETDLLALKKSQADEQKLEQYAAELVDWCWDQATDDKGKQVKFTIDAALRGEAWIPGQCVHNGKRIAILETVYEVTEV